ncbi:unnamed protein product [Amoebophrya sp. A120]|nr:unnamed protein product [Amoebophrya sp. A120]|eukprot:GSA120T00008388001.1
MPPPPRPGDDDDDPQLSETMDGAANASNPYVQYEERDHQHDNLSAPARRSNSQSPIPSMRGSWTDREYEMQISERVPGDPVGLLQQNHDRQNDVQDDDRVYSDEREDFPSTIIQPKNSNRTLAHEARASSKEGRVHTPNSRKAVPRRDADWLVRSDEEREMEFAEAGRGQQPVGTTGSQSQSAYHRAIQKSLDDRAGNKQEPVVQQQQQPQNTLNLQMNNQNNVQNFMIDSHSQEKYFSNTPKVTRYDDDGSGSGSGSPSEEGFPYAQERTIEFSGSFDNGSRTSPFIDEDLNGWHRSNNVAGPGGRASSSRNRNPDHDADYDYDMGYNNTNGRQNNVNNFRTGNYQYGGAQSSTAGTARRNEQNYYQRNANNRQQQHQRNQFDDIMSSSQQFISQMTSSGRDFLQSNFFNTTGSNLQMNNPGGGVHLGRNSNYSTATGAAGPSPGTMGHQHHFQPPNRNMTNNLGSPLLGSRTGSFGSPMNNNFGTNFPTMNIDEEYNAVTNVDDFLTHLYRYYEAKGLHGRVADHLGHLVALAFTIGFSFLLVFYVNWPAIFSCKSEATCEKVVFFYDKPFSSLSLLGYIALFYFMLAGVYLVYNVFQCIEDLRHALEASAFYKDKLYIPSDDVLACMSWAEVVERIIQEQLRCPFVIREERLTALQITNIIMREENLLIGLVNNEHLENHLPYWLPKRIFYSKSVLFAFRNIIYKSFFDHKSKVDFGSLKPEILCNHFRLVGLFALIGLGPICVFVFLYFFMRHCEDFRSHRNSPLERQWTGYAEWFLREYNELPHAFKQRLEKSKFFANDIVDKQEIVSNTPLTDGIRKCVKYVSGSLLAILVVIACFDDAPLLFLKIWDKNLLWYLAVLGFIVTLSDTNSSGSGSGPFGGGGKKKRFASGSPYEGHSGATLYMEKVILDFAKCTHYIPVAWTKVFGGMNDFNPNRRLVQLHQRLSLQEKYRVVEAFARSRDELQKNFFVPRIQQLIEEIFGLCVTPILLLVYLPAASIDICNFVRNTVYQSENLGDWCSLATFELDQTDPRLSRFGKIEKSALSFALMYRNAPSDSLQEQTNALVQQRIPSGEFNQSSQTETRPTEVMEMSLMVNANTDTEVELTEADPSNPDRKILNATSSKRPIVDHDAGNNLDSEVETNYTAKAADPVWGYPMAVLRLCYDIEQLAKESFEDYNYLPTSLTELKDQFVEKHADGTFSMLPVSQFLDFDNPVWFDTTHYFWLEVLLKNRESSRRNRVRTISREPYGNGGPMGMNNSGGDTAGDGGEGENIDNQEQHHDHQTQYNRNPQYNGASDGDDLQDREMREIYSARERTVSNQNYNPANSRMQSRGGVSSNNADNYVYRYTSSATYHAPSLGETTNEVGETVLPRFRDTLRAAFGIRG